MNQTSTDRLKRLINSSDIEVISFDVFDTLLFRKVNKPETIFELTGQNFGIHGFRKLRIDAQKTADKSHEYPNADINEIYHVLAGHTDISVNWEEVKDYEIGMEKDALAANPEMLEIFCYAKQNNKRIIAVSDTYLLSDILKDILEANGFIGFDHIYCSADEHKTKTSTELFKHISQNENVIYNRILHIGSSRSDDVDIPESLGINGFLYEKNICLDYIDKAVSSDIDRGLYKILYNEKKGFWYNLGIEAGGPIYIGLYRWLKEKICSSDKRLFFLPNGGYNLYEVLKKYGHKNIEYLNISKISLLLAGTVELDDDDISKMPPYTYGQNVNEILEYLHIDPDKIKHLKDAGFVRFLDVIKNDDDIKKFKMLYKLDKEVFLERCQLERENLICYFEKKGFLLEDSLVFDRGWNGSYQYLIDRFKKAVNCTYSNFFYYFGIMNTEKSRKQLHGKHYDTYAFNFYTNHFLQSNVNESIAIYDLFFSNPHEFVFYYGESDITIDNESEDLIKKDILTGILDYLNEGLDFAEKYNVEYAPEIALGHINRIVIFPSENEAKTIGNLNIVDGVPSQKDYEKKIAYITPEQYKSDPDAKIFWMYGLLKRTDISDTLKTLLASTNGYMYPEPAPSEYHLEDDNSFRNYQKWLDQNSEEPEYKILDYNPMFSVVIPVYNTKTEQLTEAIDSVLNQHYQNFELILVDDHSSWDNVVPALKSYEDNERVHVIYRSENGHISVATNDGINIAVGDYIAFMDCDDVITPNALYEIAAKLNENPALDYIYSDEDKITEDGKIRHLPFFKPEWSPDLFMFMMYTNHLSVYRTSIVKEIGGLRPSYNGSQDYDMTLRFMEHSDNTRVGHVPKILYHWRERKESVAFALSSKNYAMEANRNAKEDALRRRGINAHCEYIFDLCQYRVVYDVVDEPLVSIIIPSKDNPRILRQCINSIKEYTLYKNYEIIIIDNGSNKKNKTEIEHYLKEESAKYLYGIYDFNFSLMCNKGAEISDGDYLLFLNDDVEIFQPDWLNRMLATAQQPHVGAVGAKLLYPETTLIQHAGVSNIIEGPSHNYITMNDNLNYYMGFNKIDYDCIAVTGACLLVESEIFKQVKGFDESFPIAYNDIDLCFKIYESGYYNVIRNDAIAYHHESLSRGSDVISPAKFLRLSGERLRLFNKHKQLFRYDPFLNVNLHSYHQGIDTLLNFNNMEQIDMLYPEGDIKLSVDVFVVNNKVHVAGWAMCPLRDDNEQLKCYVVFKNPYDRIYRTPAVRLRRSDVYSLYYGREDLMNCGFEIFADPDIICASIMPYTIGIQLVSDDGYTAFEWSDKNVSIASELNDYPEYVKPDKLEKFIPNFLEGVCTCVIDQAICIENGINVSGWGFCNGNDHYLYQTYVILKGSSNNIYKAKVHAEKSIDIATAFPGIHFLSKARFSCNILSDMLKGDRRYNIIIRFENKFDSDDYFDVETDFVIDLGMFM